MKEIPLTKGQVAWVDDNDHGWLNQWKWCATRVRHTYYAVRRAGKRFLYMHRVILPDAPRVDHRDGNGCNNQRENLRAATPAQNCQNRRLASNNKTGFKGVSWASRLNQYKAYIWDGRSIHLGYFRDVIDAARAYDVAALQRFGEFACTNFPASNYLQKGLDCEPKAG